MSDPYIGEIRIFAGNYAPQGWALCQGQHLPINSNTALFSLLGTMYGGDGVSNFALPNLAGRCVLGFGTSTTGVNYAEGVSSGSESITLDAGSLPPHTHAFSPQVSSANADLTDPSGAIPAVVNDAGGRQAKTYPAYTKAPATGSAASQQTTTAGQGRPVSVMQPYLVVNYIIALQGIYPPRN